MLPSCFFPWSIQLNGWLIISAGEHNRGDANDSKPYVPCHVAPRQWHLCGLAPAPVEDFEVLSEPCCLPELPVKLLLPELLISKKRNHSFSWWTCRQRRELRRQGKTTQQEDLKSMQGAGGEEQRKNVKQCCVSSITFHWSICGFVSARTSYNQDKSQTKRLGVNKSRREVCLSRFLIVWKLNICQRLEGLWPPHLGGRCFWSYDTGEWILKKYLVGKPEVLSVHCHCLFFPSGFLTS